jgi:predicted nucleotidyltransferase
MDQTTAIEHAKTYAQLVAKEIKPCQIVLFGSFAKGNWHEWSDIDIAIIVKKVGSDMFDVYGHLMHLTRNIDNRIEPVLLEQGNDRSGFLSTVLQTGIMLYNNQKTND